MKRGLFQTLSEAWLILVLAALFGASLAAVHTGLSPRIEANKRAETFRQLPALVLGLDAVREAVVEVGEDRVRVVAEGQEVREFAVSEREIAGHRVFALSTLEGAIVGWVAHGAGQGYADVIELLVGISPGGETITGLFVLSQKETPALGDAITTSEFRSRFVGKVTSRALSVTQAPASDEGILALTAATISSQSVCDIINRTLADLRPALSSEELGQS